MKHIWILAIVVIGFSACGGGGGQERKATGEVRKADTYDPNRGLGKFTAENLNIPSTLDAEMAEKGDRIQSVKCSACHKLTDERLVGPGWKGITERKRPEWLMNFITDPDPMIDKDPDLQAQLELCLVRMPNQNLSDEEARQIVEFMRKNDGVQ